MLAGDREVTGVVVQLDSPLAPISRLLATALREARADVNPQASHRRCYLRVAVEIPDDPTCPFVDVPRLRVAAMVEVNASDACLLGHHESDATDPIIGLQERYSLLEGGPCFGVCGFGSPARDCVVGHLSGFTATFFVLPCDPLWANGQFLGYRCEFWAKHRLAPRLMIVASCSLVAAVSAQRLHGCPLARIPANTEPPCVGADALAVLHPRALGAA